MVLLRVYYTPLDTRWVDAYGLTLTFNDSKTHRYLLSRIWDGKKPIPLFVSKCSGEADGIFLEVTNMLIRNSLYRLGYCG